MFTVYSDMFRLARTNFRLWLELYLFTKSLCLFWEPRGLQQIPVGQWSFKALVLISANYCWRVLSAINETYVTSSIVFYQSSVYFQSPNSTTAHILNIWCLFNTATRSDAYFSLQTFQLYSNIWVDLWSVATYSTQ